MSRVYYHLLHGSLRITQELHISYAQPPNTRNTADYDVKAILRQFNSRQLIMEDDILPSGALSPAVLVGAALRLLHQSSRLHVTIHTYNLTPNGPAGYNDHFPSEHLYTLANRLKFPGRHLIAETLPGGTTTAGLAMINTFPALSEPLAEHMLGFTSATRPDQDIRATKRQLFLNPPTTYDGLYDPLQRLLTALSKVIRRDKDLWRSWFTRVTLAGGIILSAPLIVSNRPKSLIPRWVTTDDVWQTFNRLIYDVPLYQHTIIPFPALAPSLLNQYIRSQLNPIRSYALDKVSEGCGRGAIQELIQQMDLSEELIQELDSLIEKVTA